MDIDKSLPSFESYEDVLNFIGLTEEELAQAPKYDDEDVALASMQALLDDGTLVGKAQLDSSGMIRLTGEGVDGHSANLAKTGELMSSWQKLVTTVAAARAGFKALRGKISDKVSELTTLNLTVGFQPGSVIIPITPARDKVEELYPNGEPLVDSEPRSLLDQAVEETVTLLSQAPNCDQDELTELLQPHGPRVAATLRATLETLADSKCDLNTSWREPGRKAVVARVTSTQAQDLRLLIQSRKLDVDEVELSGRVRTVSDLTNLVLSVGPEKDEENVHIGRGGLPQGVLRSLNVGDFVKVRCQVEQSQYPGGNSGYKYTALEVLQVKES